MKAFVIVVDFQLKAGALAQFMPLMLENATASECDEAGCQRFDVLSPHDADNERVFLHEVYDDETAFETHLQTPHFLQFRDAVAPLVVKQVVQKYWLENGG